MSSPQAAPSTEQPAKKRGRPSKSHKSNSVGPSKAKRPRGRPPGTPSKNKVTVKSYTSEVVRSEPLETQAGRVSKPTHVFNVARPEFKDNRGRKKGSKGVGRPRKSLSGTGGSKRGRGRPPKKSSDGSVKPKSTPSGSKRGRGRPPKAGGSSPKKTTSKPSGGGLGRGRGRPPKSVTGPVAVDDAAGPSTSAKRMSGSPPKSPTASPKKRDASPKSPKAAGSPPKSPQPGTSASSSSSPKKRGRGRPPKAGGSKPKTTTSSEGTKRGRGRPPKNTPKPAEPAAASASSFETFIEIADEE